MRNSWRAAGLPSFVAFSRIFSIAIAAIDIAGNSSGCGLCQYRKAVSLEYRFGRRRPQKRQIFDRRWCQDTVRRNPFRRQTALPLAFEGFDSLGCALGVVNPKLALPNPERRGSNK